MSFFPAFSCLCWLLISGTQRRDAEAASTVASIGSKVKAKRRKKGFEGMKGGQKRPKTKDLRIPGNKSNRGRIQKMEKAMKGEN